jgi:predicted site-specific integrase-resolvase
MIEYETAEQLAKRLHLSPATIKIWARDGRIPSVRISQTVRRFDPVAIDLAIKGMQQPPCEEVPNAR